MTGIFEVKDPAVFQKPANDADNTDVVAETWNFGTQATDSTNDQINGHIRAGCFIKFFDYLQVDQCVHLRNNARRLAGNCVVALPLDQFDKSAVHVERGDHHFL